MKIPHLLALGKDIVAIFPVGQVSLGHHPVRLVRMNVLVSDLDELWIDPGPGRLRTVEREGDAADLREATLQLGPLAHPVLKTFRQLGSWNNAGVQAKDTAKGWFTVYAYLLRPATECCVSAGR